MLAESRCAGGGLGGDFYAVRLRGPKRLAVVIGDACGRGEDGAKLLPNVLRRLEQLAHVHLRPSQVLGELNRSLVGELATDRFVTGAAFEIDADRGTITIANAAHVPAVLRDACGLTQVVGRASGPPLGILPQAQYFEETYKLGRGDIVVLMTDGILEAIETELSEMSTLIALLSETTGGSGAVHRSLLARLPGPHAEPPGDDMTLLSLELVAEPRAPRLPLLQRAI